MYYEINCFINFSLNLLVSQLQQGTKGKRFISFKVIMNIHIIQCYGAFKFTINVNGYGQYEFKLSHFDFELRLKKSI